MVSIGAARSAPLPTESVQVFHNQQYAAPSFLPVPYQQIAPYLHDAEMPSLKRDFFRNFRDLVFGIVMQHTPTSRSAFLNKQLDPSLPHTAMPRIAPFGYISDALHPHSAQFGLYYPDYNGAIAPEALDELDGKAS